MSGMQSSDLIEAVVKTAEHVGVHAGHHVAHHITDGIAEHGLDFLDLDDDGSISDTIPDLAQAVFDSILDLL